MDEWPGFGSSNAVRRRPHSLGGAVSASIRLHVVHRRPGRPGWRRQRRQLVAGRPGAALLSTGRGVPSACQQPVGARRPRWLRLAAGIPT